MSEVPTDLPWDVGWDKQFEDDVERLKDENDFENYRQKIIKILENPVRTGKFKKESYKGLKTIHVKQDIICFEIKPGLSDYSKQNEVEEVYFHFIDHWDNYENALTSRTRVNSLDSFTAYFPYHAGYEAGKQLNGVYESAKGVEDFNISDERWKEDAVQLIGEIDPDDHGKLEECLPDAAEVEYDPHYPF